MDINLRINIIKELELIKNNILDYIEDNHYSISKKDITKSNFFKDKYYENITINTLNLIIEYDSALNNIMNFAYLPIEKDGKVYLYVVFDEVNGDDESLENTLIGLPELNSQSNDVVTESAKEFMKEKLYPIYIMASFTKTAFGNVIKKVTKSKYTHSAISLDPSMKKMYSFNKKDGMSGFSIEDIRTYNQDEDCITYVNVFFVKLKEFLKIQEMIDWYILHRDKTKYSFLTCFGILINKGITLNNRLICSEFVDMLLKNIGVKIVDKKSSLVTPNDFTTVTNPNVYKVYEGPIRDYNPKKVSKIVDKISNTTKPIIENLNVEDNTDCKINMIDATHYLDDELTSELIDKHSIYEIYDELGIGNSFELYRNRFTGMKKLSTMELYKFYGSTYYEWFDTIIKFFYNLPFKNIKVFDREFTNKPEILLFDTVTDCNKIFYLTNKFGETFYFSIYNKCLYLLIGCGKSIFGIGALRNYNGRITIDSDLKSLNYPKKGDKITCIKDFTKYTITKRQIISLEGNFELKFLENTGIEKEIETCEEDMNINMQNKNVDGLKSDVACIVLLSNNLMNLYNNEPTTVGYDIKSKLKRMYQKCIFQINNLNRYNGTPFNVNNFLAESGYGEVIECMLGDNSISESIKWLLFKK